jgi:hypothetical protein
VIWYEFMDVSEEPASPIFKVEEEISRPFSSYVHPYPYLNMAQLRSIHFYEVRLHFMTKLISNIIPKEMFNAVMLYCRHEFFLNQE